MTVINCDGFESVCSAEYKTTNAACDCEELFNTPAYLFEYRPNVLVSKNLLTCYMTLFLEGQLPLAAFHGHLCLNATVKRKDRSRVLAREKLQVYN